jgi:hypothetical protein
MTGPLKPVTPGWRGGGAGSERARTGAQAGMYRSNQLTSRVR